MSEEGSGMNLIDMIFSSMDRAKREELKRNIRLFQKSGDPAAKRTVLNIMRECDDAAAIRKFLNIL